MKIRSDKWLWCGKVPERWQKMHFWTGTDWERAGVLVGRGVCARKGGTGRFRATVWRWRWGRWCPSLATAVVLSVQQSGCRRWQEIIWGPPDAITAPLRGRGAERWMFGRWIYPFTSELSSVSTPSTTVALQPFEGSFCRLSTLMQNFDICAIDW